MSTTPRDQGRCRRLGGGEHGAQQASAQISPPAPSPIMPNGAVGGLGVPPPAVAPPARKIMRGPTFYWHLTTKHKAACVLPCLIACAVYTHAPISPAQAEPAFLLFLLLLALRGCGPTGESLPSKGATTARRRRDFWLCVCACFAVKRGRAFCIVLCSLDAPERHAICRGVVACRMKQPALL